MNNLWLEWSNYFCIVLWLLKGWFFWMQPNNLELNRMVQKNFVVASMVLVEIFCTSTEVTDPSLVCAGLPFLLCKSSNQSFISCYRMILSRSAVSTLMSQAKPPKCPSPEFADDMFLGIQAQHHSIYMVHSQTFHQVSTYTLQVICCTFPKLWL